MQLQITKIKNGYFIASPPDFSKVDVSRCTAEQMQQMASKPEITFCEGYDAVCVHLKRFFFSPDKN